MCTTTSTGGLVLPGSSAGAAPFSARRAMAINPSAAFPVSAETRQASSTIAASSAVTFTCKSTMPSSHSRTRR
jgi:hypothetical protein